MNRFSQRLISYSQVHSWKVITLASTVYKHWIVISSIDLCFGPSAGLIAYDFIVVGEEKLHTILIKKRTKFALDAFLVLAWQLILCSQLHGFFKHFSKIIINQRIFNNHSVLQYTIRIIYMQSYIFLLTFN